MKVKVSVMKTISVLAFMMNH